MKRNFSVFAMPGDIYCESTAEFALDNGVDGIELHFPLTSASPPDDFVARTADKVRFAMSILRT